MSEVVHNTDAYRFELVEDGEMAVAEYIREDDTIIFTHTIVPPALEGRGIGSRLIRSALDTVHAMDLHVVPKCSFVAAYIDRHPEYHELVA